jgi:hypothetical protein
MVEQELEAALGRLYNAHYHYRVGDPLERRLLNQAIFERLLIGTDGEIEAVELSKVCRDMTPCHAIGTRTPARNGHKVSQGPASGHGRKRPNPNPRLWAPGFDLLAKIGQRGQRSNPQPASSLIEALLDARAARRPKSR